MERVKTGIPGFDELVEGGLPKGFNVLLAGAPGTGKTIFGLQYLYNGAKNGENGIYVSLDSSEKRLKGQALQFGWDFDGLKKNGNDKEGDVLFLEVPVDRVRVNLFDMIEDAVKQVQAKRLVFDNLANFVINSGQFVIPLNFVGDGSTSKDKFSRYLGSETQENMMKGRTLYNTAPPENLSLKRTTYLIIHELGKLDTTNILITFEKKGGGTMDEVSEFAADGVVSMNLLAVGETLSRTIEVTKMRTTKIDGGIKSYDIDKEGIKLIY